MKHLDSPIMIGMAVMVVAVTLTGSCSSLRRSTGGRSSGGGNDNTHSVVSSVPLPQSTPVPTAPAPQRVELYYGEGDCAPRFANGMRGTCINNQPCNGFGVKDEKGNLQCECFGAKGGCPEGTVCSVTLHACVPLREAQR